MQWPAIPATSFEQIQEKVAMHTHMAGLLRRLLGRLLGALILPQWGCKSVLRKRHICACRDNGGAGPREDSSQTWLHEAHCRLQDALCQEGQLSALPDPLQKVIP